LDPSPELLLTTTSVGFRRVLTIAGSVVGGTVQTLQLELNRLVASGAREVWLDLLRVEVIDSTGIAALVAFAAELERRGRTLALIAPDGPVRRGLRGAGVHDRFRVFDDRVDAHRSS
jgi:anti-anti-sigma factor